METQKLCYNLKDEPPVVDGDVVEVDISIFSDKIDDIPSRVEGVVVGTYKAADENFLIIDFGEQITKSYKYSISLIPVGMVFKKDKG